MTALGVGAIVFACVFAGALFGMFLGSVLPKEHLSENAKDVIKVTMAMIATLAALVLGLLTASAKSSLDDKENAVRSWAAQAVLLDRTLAQYGPEAQGARDLLKRQWSPDRPTVARQRGRAPRRQRSAKAPASRAFSKRCSRLLPRRMRSAGSSRPRCRPPAPSPRAAG